MKTKEGLRTEAAAHLASEQTLMKRINDGDCHDVLVVVCSDIEIAALLPKPSPRNGPVVLANAGCIVPRSGPWNSEYGSEAATVEYAVVGLGVKDIIVCGHSRCKSTRALWRNEMADTQFVVPWHLTENHLLSRTAAEEHVLKQLQNLRTYPPVKAKVAARNLALHGWLYEVESDRMFAYSSKQDRFVCISAQPSDRHSVSVPACTHRLNFRAADRRDFQNRGPDVNRHGKRHLCN